MLFMNVLSTVNAAMQEKATLAVYKDTFRCLSDYQLTWECRQQTESTNKQHTTQA